MRERRKGTNLDAMAVGVYWEFRGRSLVEALGNVFGWGDEATTSLFGILSKGFFDGNEPRSLNS
jgi:hypothetical protein